MSKTLDMVSALQVDEAIRIYDNEGKELGRAFVENRTSITIDNISPYMIQAILAIEDSNFYQHDGVFIKALLRAMYANIKVGGIAQGGSTITQQLSKHVINDHSRSIDRKLRELFVALRLERELQKDEILMLYLNRVFFGSGFYGVEAASKGYFGKHAKDLTLAESSLLAGLVKSPSRLSPHRNLQGALERQALVLQRMVEVGYISDNDIDLVKASPPEILPRFRKTIGVKSYPAARALSLVESVIDESEDLGELEIWTTIDSKLQDALEKTVANLPHEVAAGIVSLKDGKLLAYVGGTDYLKTQFDRFFSMTRDAGHISLYTLLANRSDLLNGGTMLPISKGATQLIPLQDAITLNLRSALDTVFPNTPSKPSDVMQEYLLLQSGNYSPLWLVDTYKVGNKSKRLVRNPPPLPKYSEDSRKNALATFQLAAAESAKNRREYFIQTSVNQLDGWLVSFLEDKLIVIWMGFDKPKPLDGTYLENTLTALADTLHDSSPLQYIPVPTTVVSRASGKSLPEDYRGVAGTIQVAVPSTDSFETESSIYTQLPVFKDMRNASLHQVRGNAEHVNGTPVTMQLPAPRPVLLTQDDTVIVDSPLTLKNFLFWPRVEKFSNTMGISEYLNTLDIPNPRDMFVLRRGVPTLVDFENDYTVEWPTYDRRYLYPELYNIITGVAGVEQDVNYGKPKKYEPLFPLLRGRDGLEFLVDYLELTKSGSVTYFPDFLGYPQRAEFLPPLATPGIELTLRHDFQIAAYDAMQSINKGAFVIINAKNGDVVASISKPITDKLNRVTQEHSPAGSAFKPFTILAKRILDPMFNKDSLIPLGDVVLPGATFSFPREGGSASLRQAMASSFNSYFIRAIYEQDPAEFGGIVKSFGFGRRSGFILGDISGLVPTPQYVLDRHQRTMGKGDMANFAIGQGDLLVTPLQMARAYAALATRGFLPNPRLLLSEPILVRPLAIDPGWDFWGDLDDSLRAVVTSGTGRGGAHTKYSSLRAKTGTAQVGPKRLRQLNAWYCGYFKHAGEIYSFAILVEGAPHQSISGGGAAAPVLKRFLDQLKEDAGAQEFIFDVPGVDEVLEEDFGTTEFDVPEFEISTQPINNLPNDYRNSIDDQLRKSLFLD